VTLTIRSGTAVEIPAFIDTMWDAGVWTAIGTVIPNHFAFIDSDWGYEGPTALSGTGGSIVAAPDGFTYHTITANVTFDPRGSRVCDWIAVGGGAASGGGRNFINHNAGGAGGECRHGSTTISTPQAITIGVGGAFNNAAQNGTPGSPGGSTVFGTIATAPGGEGGGTDGPAQGGDSGNELGATNGGGPGTGFSSGGGAGADGNGALQTAGGGYNWLGLGVYYGGGGHGRNNAGSYPEVTGSETLGRRSASPGTDGWGQGGGSDYKGGSGVVIVRYPTP
jgi:hypothetical protein